ncbi:MAG: carboxypeptidase-like regulatory domain-containing protein [Planctomycetota bacterium]
MMRHRLLFPIALFSVAALLGCSGAPRANYGRLNLVDAYGTVTLDGKPLPNAVVTFDAEDGQFSYGLTDSRGRYKLQIDSVKSGVTPGRKTVRISTSRKILGLNSSEEESGGGEGASESGRAKELVPDKYYKKSELTAEVSASNTTFNFELKSSSASGGGT